jgi:hypothetical protein
MSKKHIVKGVLKTLDAFKKAAQWSGEGAERHRRITFRMAVPLSDLVFEDIEWLNDRADKEILGDDLGNDLGGVGLSDLSYKAVDVGGNRHSDIGEGSCSYMAGTVVLEVSASVEDIIVEGETLKELE